MTQKYLIVIEKAGNGFSAYSPDVPGCIAAGKTAEATEVAMQEAIAFHIEGLIEHGEPIPAPRSRVAFATIKNGSSKNSPGKPAYHIWRGAGMWVVKRDNALRASKVYRTKDLALKHARQLAEKHSAQVVIHNTNGTIRELRPRASKP